MTFEEAHAQLAASVNRDFGGFGFDPFTPVTGPTYTGTVPIDLGGLGGSGSSGGGSTSTKTTVTASAGCSGAQAYIDPFCWFQSAAGSAGNQILRLILLILGLICIIGSIYLFKSTAPIIQVPLNAAKRGIATVGETLAATG